MGEITPERLTSQDVAEMLQVSVETVYKLRTSANKGVGDFPRPVAFDGPSPLYDAEAIAGFIARRRERRAGAGRRARVYTEQPGTFAARLRQAILDGRGGTEIPTQRALIDRLGLNAVTFGHRLRATTRWKASELEIIADLVGVDTSDANEEVDRVRAEKAARRRHERSS